MKLTALAAALSLAACASAPPAPEAARIYHYLRSNQDGGLPENVWVYLPDATHVEVYKMVERCANAAYVTAVLDPERRQPVSFIGGRVARDGTQEQFAWLDYANAALHARVPSANIDQQVNVGSEPWLLFDFDLGDLNGLHAGRPAQREDFAFWTVLIWPDGGDDPFRTLGETRVHFLAEDTRFGRPALRYEVSGGLNGQLWLDASQGNVLEARFAEPNHTGYSDFRLALEGISDGGQAEWRARLAAHWEGCPPESEN